MHIQIEKWFKSNESQRRIKKYNIKRAHEIINENAK